MIQHKQHAVGAGTPCPVGASSGVSRRRPWRDSLVSNVYGRGDDEDTTANVEFTSAFGKPDAQPRSKPNLQSSLMGGKPRRTHGNGSGNGEKRGGNAALGFTIYDDEGEEVASPRRSIDGHVPGNALAMPAKRGVMAQPPQRPKNRVSFMHSSTDAEVRAPALPAEGASKPRPNQSQRQARRMSQAPPRRPPVRDGCARNETQKQQQQPNLAPLPEDMDLTMPTADYTTTILKPARRGTIYIPNEDTTMPSMYMGIFSPIKDLDTRAIVEAAGVPDSELTGIAAQMVRKRAPARRLSVMAASPKRMGGPLQIVSRPVQESAAVEDRLGQATGKENVPPGQDRAKRWDGMEKKITVGMKPARRASGAVQKNLSEEHRSLAASMAGLSLNQEPVKHSSSRIFAPTTSSLSKGAGRPMPNNSGMSVKTSWNAGPKVSITQDTAATTKKSPSNKPMLPDQRQEPVVPKKPTVPSRFVVPTAIIKNEFAIPLPPPQTYPLVTENLPTPAMYEDNWLHHQEIAMTQLVNNLFEQSKCTPSQDPVDVDGSMLRIRLLEMYGNAENALLYKRLQAALMYGAFRATTEGLMGSAKLSCDVGKRKAFTDLWLTTYDLGCLRAALEAVVGRMCSGASPSGSPTTAARRKEGSGGNTSDEEIQMNRVRQSLRRFIETFLIRNEDGEPDEAIPSSSTAHASWSYQRTMLRSLMLIKLLDTAPIGGCLFQSSSSYKSSLGPIQALFQMLNPSAGDPLRALGHIGYNVSHVQHPLEEYNYTIQNLAVDLRDGVRLTRLVEFLLVASDESPVLEEGQIQDWPRRPLSQHLKFPCLGRATKIHNVQVALNALHNIQGMASLTHDITADDIVDGFREKTVKLLWGLTSKWGVGGLLDWGDVEREIKRLGHANRSMGVGGQISSPNILVGDEDGCSRYRRLLVLWAQVIASKRGISVSNMTTSFADGQVFEGIVDEYQEYIISDQRRTDRKHLSERLRGLGCSDQFSGLFSPSSSSLNRTHVFDQDFVMAALAFLCSRLLGPSRSWRAAVTIQKAWRMRCARALKARKSQLKMMAEGCASVVCAGRGGVIDEDEAKGQELPVGRTVNTAPQGKDGEAEAEAKTETMYDTDRTMGREVSVSLDENADEPEGDIWLNL